MARVKKSLNKEERAKIKKVLLKKAAKYEHRLVEINETIRKEKTEEAADRSCIRGNTHLADCTNACSVLGNPEQMRYNQIDCIKKINAALIAVDSDPNFGICQECDDLIELKCLLERPFAKLCVACASEKEKKQKSLKSGSRSFMPKYLNKNSVAFPH